MTANFSTTGGYDFSKTISEQIVLTNARITSLLAKGREGTTAIQSARQQLADLQAQQTNVAAAQTTAKAQLAAHATANPKGTVAPMWPNRDVTE